jgi:hypothetical protein
MQRRHREVHPTGAEAFVAEALRERDDDRVELPRAQTHVHEPVTHVTKEWSFAGTFTLHAEPLTL